MEKYTVVIDAASPHEIKQLNKATGFDVWKNVDFDTEEKADAFALYCKKLCPLIEVAIVI